MIRLLCKSVSVWVVLCLVWSTHVEAQTVLLAPTQGMQQARAAHGKRAMAALRKALAKRKINTVGPDVLLGGALLVCETKACRKQAFDSAGAEFGLVPTVWQREGQGAEFGLALVTLRGRQANASRPVQGDWKGSAESVLATVLDGAPPYTPGQDTENDQRANSKLWLAGPIALIALGSGAVLAVGVAAGAKASNERLKTGPVAAWSTLGAAAIGGGITWWLLGNKRHHHNERQTSWTPTPNGLLVHGTF